MMTCWWSTPPRWSVADQRRPRNAPSCWAGPNTEAAPLTQGYLDFRPRMICTLQGLPEGWALVGAKTNERGIATALITHTTVLAGYRLTWIEDKDHFGRGFETELADAGITLLPVDRKGE